MLKGGLHFITPVWGREYTRCFLNVCLPSLLAPGNIPSLKSDGQCIYSIYTTPDDLRVIQNSSAFELLRRCLPVFFHPIRQKVDQTTNQYFVQSDCYRRGIRTADKADAGIIFINADVVVADGGIRALTRILTSGKRAILALGIRLNKNAVAARLLEHHSSSAGAVISIKPRELAALALPNIHQITKAHLFHGEGEDLHPAGLFWRVGDEGLLAHCFHLHPLVVCPTVKNAPFSVTIDEDYLMASCPDKNDHYIIQDSDEFLACELTDENRQIPAIPRTSNLREIAKWAYSNANTSHRELIRHAIKIHAGQSDLHAWSETEREAQKVVDEVLAYLRTDVEAQSELVVNNVLGPRQGNGEGAEREESFGELLAEQTRLTTAFARRAQNYLVTKGVFRRQLPFSIIKVAGALLIVGAFVCLRSSVRAYRKMHNFLAQISSRRQFLE